MIELIGIDDYKKQLDERFKQLTEELIALRLVGLTLDDFDFANGQLDERVIEFREIKTSIIEAFQIPTKDDLFEEICQIETTAKNNYVDEHIGITKVLDWLKDNNKNDYKRLIELYKEYYGNNSNKFWLD